MICSQALFQLGNPVIGVENQGRHRAAVDDLAQRVAPIFERESALLVEMFEVGAMGFRLAFSLLLAGDIGQRGLGLLLPGDLVESDDEGCRVLPLVGAGNPHLEAPPQTVAMPQAQGEGGLAARGIGCQ